MGEFDFFIRTKQDLIDAVLKFGFVPLFKNSIPGFSVAEHVAKEAWFESEEGVAEYSTPECFMKEAFTAQVYKRTPEESYARVLQHLKELVPWADEAALKKLLR